MRAACLAARGRRSEWAHAQTRSPLGPCRRLGSRRGRVVPWAALRGRLGPVCPRAARRAHSGCQ
eukprot:1437394-Lingulodinium_polyedra.AAC.1